MSSVTATEIASPAPLAAGNEKLISELKKIVGGGNVLTHPTSTRRFRKGYRTGIGPALAVVRPGTLVEQWRVLNACAAAGKIVIMQAANTGLTGGSTPDGDQYDRDVVIINTLRMTKIHLINEGRQAVCLPAQPSLSLKSYCSRWDAPRTPLSARPASAPRSLEAFAITPAARSFTAARRSLK